MLRRMANPGGTVRRRGGRRRRRRPCRGADRGDRRLSHRSSSRRRRAFPPGRTAALLQGSIDLLSELDVWPALAQHAAPLTGDPPRRRDAAADPRAGGDLLRLRDRPAGLRLQHPERRARRCAAAGTPRAFEDLTIVAEPVEVDRAQRRRACRFEAASETLHGAAWSSPPTARGRWRARRPAFACGAGTIPRRRSSRRFASSTRIKASRRSSTPRAAPSRWCRCRATA